MAKRPVFLSNILAKGYVEEVLIEFEWFPGFSKSQKQKSIRSLHNNFLDLYKNEKVLEISSKSPSLLGVSLSAFNLSMNINNKLISIEAIFQASKVFEFGGPFVDIIEKSSYEAKTDSRLKTSGKLLYFEFMNKKWPLEPKTIFYDWLYINALTKKDSLVLQRKLKKVMDNRLFL